MSQPRDLHPSITAASVRLRRWAQDGLMPFREARPLTSGERQRVALLWSGAGACFSCLWAAALVLLLPGARGAVALALIVGIALVGALFFGAVALLVVGLFSRTFARDARTAPAPGSKQPRLARDRQPLPLDPE
jgi:hypothetical protein